MLKRRSATTAENSAPEGRKNDSPPVAAAKEREIFCRYFVSSVSARDFAAGRTIAANAIQQRFGQTQYKVKSVSLHLLNPMPKQPQVIVCLKGIFSSDQEMQELGGKVGELLKTQSQHGQPLNAMMNFFPGTFRGAMDV